MAHNRFYFYILANRPKGVLYVGSTGDLSRRLNEHKGQLAASFTAKYGLTLLVYFEEYPTIAEARQRERAVKHWRRDWKFELVERLNPAWSDLSLQLAL
jgi:putative endonuclease